MTDSKGVRWKLLKEGEYDASAVNRPHPVYVGFVETGVSPSTGTSGNDCSRYKVTFHGYYVIPLGDTNLCWWGNCGTVLDCIQWYGRQTIKIAVYSYGDGMRSGNSARSWKLWEMVE